MSKEKGYRDSEINQLRRQIDDLQAQNRMLEQSQSNIKKGRRGGGLEAEDRLFDLKQQMTQLEKENERLEEDLDVKVSSL